ncbi:hypothetical protein [Nostoc sp. ChiQUE01b]|uniref:hypothetical protein n=1 Tax=Nostoc sp. ChiQUE01b TaxID=3075376 RepID=UPI002AD533D9|nr:hypothetical protein [Nostoc sp. ChiQUE01b]MDZ8262197.1 hypothetical protein [Nostoc sp. ChiQUE01b]
MDSKSTSIQIFDLPCLEEADDTLTANIRGRGGQTTAEIGACGVAAIAGLTFGAVGSIVAGTVCLMVANAD